MFEIGTGNGLTPAAGIPFLKARNPIFSHEQRCCQQLIRGIRRQLGGRPKGNIRFIKPARFRAVSSDTKEWMQKTCHLKFVRRLQTQGRIDAVRCTDASERTLKV